MTQRAMFQLVFLDLIIIHFMLAAFASIVSASHYRLPADHASWKVASTRPADSVVLTNRLLAASARTFDLLAR